MNLKRSTSTIEAAEKKEKRVLIQMSVLVVAFLLFWLPFWVYLMTMHICLVVYDEEYCWINVVEKFGTVSSIIFHYLGYMNSLVNPFLYTAFNREFRSAFWEIFTCKF